VDQDQPRDRYQDRQHDLRRIKSNHVRRYDGRIARLTRNQPFGAASPCRQLSAEEIAKHQSQLD
jgi:hypothetical protein